MTYHKWSLVIMRAQPFHLWHKQLVDRALATTPRVLLILGSHSEERTARNPWLMVERKAMIRAVYPYAKRLTIAAAFDMPGKDDEWREQIERIVASVTEQEKCLLVANAKDGEDYLERIFHGWPASITRHNYETSATDIRRMYFGRARHVARYVPAQVADWLERFRHTEPFQEMERGA